MSILWDPVSGVDRSSTKGSAALGLEVKRWHECGNMVLLLFGKLPAASLARSRLICIAHIDLGARDMISNWRQGLDHHRQIDSDEMSVLQV